jgi:hypothetical protein
VRVLLFTEARGLASATAIKGGIVVPGELAGNAGAAAPQEPPPAGNLASWLDANGFANSLAMNAFSSFLGTLADIGGSIALIESIVNRFRPDQQDPYLAQILQTIQQYFVKMYEDLEATLQEQIWMNLSELVSDSVAVVQSLPTLLTEQPPPTDDFRVDQVEACLKPVDTLTDTTLSPTGNYFVSAYSNMTYWTDAGLYIATYFYIDDDGNQAQATFDVGYGTQAPPKPAGPQIFSYLYFLPYCVKAHSALIVTGVALYPDFGTITLWQASLVSYAQFLTTIHDTIAGGITKLTPPDPSLVDWYTSIGVITGNPTTGILPTDAGAVIWIVGAVEIYSGYSSINNIQDTSSAGTEEATYQKLQVRALRELIRVYKGVGLPNVWSVINTLNQLTQQTLLPLHKYAGWSFQEIFSLAGVAARGDGLLHLSDLATLIAQTSPLDTTQTGPSFSFRGLLEPS